MMATSSSGRCRSCSKKPPRSFHNRRVRAVALLALAACGRIDFAAIGDDGGAGDIAPVCALRLGAGRQHTTAVLPDQTLRVWGYGFYGQIGDGMTMDRPAPIAVLLPGPVIHAAGGRFETCAAVASGEAWCWGEGNSGQLGDGNSTNSPSPVKV